MKRKNLLLAVCIILLGIIIYQYPLQKALAQRSFENYISKQGIASENINSKRFFKDWKRGGYLVVVTFNDDINNKYYYHYDVWTHKRGESLKFNKMTLEITDIEKSMVLDPPYDGKCKHPPIDEWFKWLSKSNNYIWKNSSRCYSWDGGTFVQTRCR